MIKRKLYVLVEKTLRPVYGCVQGGHAVAQWMIEHPNSREWHNDYLIYLSADISKWKRKLEFLEVNYTEFKEPDLDNQTTALAVFGHEELFKNLKVVTEN
jgi:hypothetical protein